MVTTYDADVRAADAAGDRRVERVDAGLPRHLMHGAGAVDVDGRAVDEERALPGDGQEIGPDRADMLGGGEHGDDDVRIALAHGGDRRGLDRDAGPGRRTRR